ncbi:protein MON2 homolog [Trichonephila clavipes]|nr:protein MON2 homolog [Trichonephila clavipes]
MTEVMGSRYGLDKIQEALETHSGPHPRCFDSLRRCRGVEYLDEVALHHLIDALCKLSSESMELAYTNREPSLFAVAKLLETGLVNLFRVEVLWRPVTNHLLEVCQHPHIRMREWGAEAVTFLVKAALYHKYTPSLKENKKLQTMLLSPLQELSSIPHPDIRQKQLDCALQVLHSSGDIISSGWPQLLDVISAINEDHGESLIRSAFQCLQLVVADYPPVMPCTCLQLCVDAAAKFGSQTQELNVSLAAVGLLWNIADHLYQNEEKISQSLSSATEEELVALNSLQISNYEFRLLPFDRLWLSLFCRLGDLCVDSRPAVRKSAGQTLFSTLGAHGSLLQQTTWQVVLWQVLFPLLDRVRSLSGTASTDKITDMGGNILIHHSRNTAQKQWAETQVLTLSGVARIFHTKRDVLQTLGDFPRAWALLLEFIESSSLSKNNEVSFSALKSFQEILNISRFQDVKAGKAEPVVEKDKDLQR